VAHTTVEQLQAVLNEHRGRLAELPDVVGWGVGLGVDGHPIVQVFVSAPLPDDVAAEFRQLFGRFDVVAQSRPAEAY
jgi:hypothetical protein